LAVLRPLKLVIENYPEGQVEEMEAVNNPEDPSAGSRKVPFSRVLYIEQDDFRDPAPPKYFRLSPGAEVRLRYAYIVKCTGVERDGAGQVVEVRCTYDPDSRGGDSRGRRVRGTIHWVSSSHSIPAEVRLYDHLFSAPRPDDADDWKSVLNPQSLEVVRGAWLEPTLAGVDRGARLPFGAPGAGRGASRRWPASTGARASSSSATATSASTRATRRRLAWCSIARSDCATRGRRSKKVRARGRGAWKNGSSSRVSAWSLRSAPGSPSSGRRRW